MSLLIFMLSRKNKLNNVYSYSNLIIIMNSIDTFFLNLKNNGLNALSSSLPQTISPFMF